MDMNVSIMLSNIKENSSLFTETALIIKCTFQNGIKLHDMTLNSMLILYLKENLSLFTETALIIMRAFQDGIKLHDITLDSMLILQLKDNVSEVYMKYQDNCINDVVVSDCGSKYCIVLHKYRNNGVVSVFQQFSDIFGINCGC